VTTADLQVKWDLLKLYIHELIHPMASDRGDMRAVKDLPAGGGASLVDMDVVGSKLALVRLGAELLRFRGSCQDIAFSSFTTSFPPFFSLLPSAAK
jgi:hypothetical protein